MFAKSKVVIELNVTIKVQVTKFSNHFFQNCPEIIECLSAGNFSRFVQHINGLLSVYSLPDAASAADKTRAWTALTVLEQDLESIFSSYRYADDL